jgi:two-component system, OmpR family, response regulator CpxR
MRRPLVRSPCLINCNSNAREWDSMPAISFFYTSSSKHEEVIDQCARVLDCPVVDDLFLIHAAAERFAMPEESIRDAVFSRNPSFNRFTHEKEKFVSAIKYVLAGCLQDDPLVLSGFCSHLIPRTVSHVLRVNLVLDLKDRVLNVIQERGVTRDEAMATIVDHDLAASRWTEYLRLKSPWDYEHYDLVLPLGKKDLHDAVATIVNHARKDLFKKNTVTQKSIEDFQLAAAVEIGLAMEGHYVLVEVHNGNVTLSIPHNVIMLSRLGEELRRITQALPGVVHVSIKPDPGMQFRGMHRPQDEESRSKLLLVDDEKEFVHTLSERLFMREIGSDVVYDGEQALTFIETEQPEVIVLDLKMPGLDGIEVLRRIKASHPEIQVIILTGHGSRDDEKACMELGAFAYLQKPVDIDVLTGLLDKAKLRP